MTVTKRRETLETQIELTLDKSENNAVQKSKLKIGVPFFEHMLTAFFFYSDLSATVQCVGDLEIDPHHTLEDLGIVLGEAVYELARRLTGYERYASNYLPMDDALVRTVLDISGRPYFQLEGLPLWELTALEQSMVEFMRSFAINARLTVHMDVIRGHNRHHIFEALFKSFGKALGNALEPKNQVMSTKGCIG